MTMLPYLETRSQAVARIADCMFFTYTIVRQWRCIAVDLSALLFSEGSRDGLQLTLLVTHWSFTGQCCQEL